MSSFLLAAAASLAMAAPVVGPVVVSQEGPVRGVAAADGVTAFKGLPYAAAPVGSLRWRAPQAPAAWTQVRDGGVYGPNCPQPPFPGEEHPLTGPMSEDCLYLNIWTPSSEVRRDPGALWPVMVSIHGGGLINGGGGGGVFDGAALARRGIVVVTLNYRLGRLGFFGLSALEQESPGEPSVNYGFMDQIAALVWVQRNIAAFGGDPKRVTIVGESAGGQSVVSLMVSPRARGLFSAAIAQSAPVRIAMTSHTDALKTGEAFAQSVGLDPGDLHGLRALPVEKVLKGVNFFQQDKKTYAGATIDGDLLPEPVLDAFAAGRQARAPFIIGTTDLELAAIPAFIATAGFEKSAQADRKNLLAVYDPAGTRPLGDVAVEVLSEGAFAEPTRAITRLAVAAGQPVWNYRFAYVAEHERPKARGARHASDVAYTFDTLGAMDPRADANDLKVAAQVADYWAAFVRDHDPNVSGLPRWPQAGRKGEVVLQIGPSGIAAGVDPLGPRLDALEVIATRQTGESSVAAKP